MSPLNTLSKSKVTLAFLLIIICCVFFFFVCACVCVWEGVGGGGGGAGLQEYVRLNVIMCRGDHRSWIGSSIALVLSP